MKTLATLAFTLLVAGTASPQTSTRARRNDPLSVELDGHLKDGADAERRRDFATAEREYRDVARMVPNTPLGYDLLAHLYESTGRGKDAYGSYQEALRDFRGTSTNLRPCGVLSRFGDLAVRYGTVEEAKAAYATAAAASSRDDVWDPAPIPRSQSLAALKAAAHTAAAIVDMYGGEVDPGDGPVGHVAAARELDLAISADPSYWVAYFYRTFADRRAGRRDDAVRDAANAERLAPPKGRRKVRWMRAGYHIPDLQGRYLKIPPVFDGQSPLGPPEIPDPVLTKTE